MIRAEELREKTLYYLANEKAAQKIAAAGHRRCLSGGHTYDDRVLQMVRIATGAKQGAKRARG